MALICKECLVLPHARSMLIGKSLAPTRRVMSLREPTSKMSKSHTDERSRILLTDTNESIHKKIKLALTDSEPSIKYDPVRRPGVANLIEIIAHIEGRKCEELALEYQSATLGSLKGHVAERISSHLGEIREKYFALIDDRTGYLDVIADQGAQTASANAEFTVKKIKNAMGL